MVKVTLVCDRCAKEATGTSEYGVKEDNNYHTVKISLGNYNKKSYCLCSECMNKYGLLKENKKTAQSQEEPSIQDKLFELIYDIATEAAQDCQNN